MLETPHVVVGAAIATRVANPALAIPIAFVSHFLLEKVPHWNPHLNTETQKFGKPTKRSTIIVLIDASLAVTSAALIASTAYPDTLRGIVIFAAGMAAALPDIVEGPYFFLNFRPKFIKRWILFQKSIQVDAPIIPGLLTQALTLLGAFWWVF